MIIKFLHCQLQYVLVRSLQEGFAAEVRQQTSASHHAWLTRLYFISFYIVTLVRIRRTQCSETLYHLVCALLIVEGAGRQTLHVCCAITTYMTKVFCHAMYGKRGVVERKMMFPIDFSVFTSDNSTKILCAIVMAELCNTENCTDSVVMKLEHCHD